MEMRDEGLEKAAVIVLGLWLVSRGGVVLWMLLMEVVEPRRSSSEGGISLEVESN